MTEGRRWWQPTPAAEAFARIVALVMAVLFLLSAVAFALPLVAPEPNSPQPSSVADGWAPVVFCLLASAYGVLYAKLGQTGMSRLLGRVVWPSKRK